LPGVKHNIAWKLRLSILLLLKKTERKNDEWGETSGHHNKTTSDDFEFSLNNNLCSETP
jgi:hypothetical protein